MMKLIIAFKFLFHDGVCAMFLKEFNVCAMSVKDFMSCHLI